VTPWFKIGILYVLGFVWPLNVGCWELHTVQRAEQYWNWSGWQVGVLEYGVLQTVVPVTMVGWPKYMIDRTGITAFMTVAVIAYLFMFNYIEWTPEVGSGTFQESGDKGKKVDTIVLYTIGSFFLVNGNMIARGFTWALITKLAPIPSRAKVLGINAAVYMFGRGCGALLTPAVSNPNTYAAVLGCWTAAAAVVLLVAYQILPGPEEKK